MPGSQGPCRRLVRCAAQSSVGCHVAETGRVCPEISVHESKRTKNRNLETKNNNFIEY